MQNESIRDKVADCEVSKKKQLKLPQIWAKANLTANSRAAGVVYLSFLIWHTSDLILQQFTHSYLHQDSNSNKQDEEEFRAGGSDVLT